MKLNKASLFALFAVLELARDPECRLSTSEIAAKYGISTNHLAKIMSILLQEGLVQAVRGAGGGYRFAGSAQRTTLFDVIQLFDMMESELDVPGHVNRIVSELLNISNEIDNLTKAVLDSVTLATALKYSRKCSGALT